jgi:hypothetical protein
MVQLSATRCSYIAILCVSLVSFAAITLCVASLRVFIVVYFVIDSVRKLLDIPSYNQLLNRIMKMDVSYFGNLSRYTYHLPSPPRFSRRMGCFEASYEPHNFPN